MIIYKLPPCDDGGGDPGWIPTVPDEPVQINLSIVLNLNNEQSSWLATYFQRASQIGKYLELSSSTDKYTIAVEHINRMMNDAEYLAFVENHALSGNQNKMWWEDEGWLDNHDNFSLSLNNAQGEYDLTLAEKALIPLFPIQAYIIGEINRPKALSMTSEKFGLNGGLNDKKDAFRHAYFNAINTRDVPPRLVPVLMPASEIVRLFGIAHESETPTPLILEKQMDLFNNEVGINYCWNCISGISSDESIAGGIMQKMNAGQLRYLAPLDFNLYPLTNGIYIETELTPSNQ